MKGLYIIEFLIYPGVYKIGRSKNIENRFKQFKNNTAILGNVTLIYLKEFTNEKKAEKSVHQILKDFRVLNNREFFKGDIEYFKKAIDYVSSREELYDYSKFFYTLISKSAPHKKIRQGVQRKILLWLCGNMEVNTNIVYLTTVLRKKMCKELNISTNQVTHGLRGLLDLLAIHKTDRKIIVNPYYYWKGELSERDKLLQDKELQITFELVDNKEE